LSSKTSGQKFCFWSWLSPFCFRICRPREQTSHLKGYLLPVEKIVIVVEIALSVQGPESLYSFQENTYLLFIRYLFFLKKGGGVEFHKRAQNPSFTFFPDSEILWAYSRGILPIWLAVPKRVASGKNNRLREQCLENFSSDAKDNPLKILLMKKIFF
jgi:hypothetical protein